MEDDGARLRPVPAERYSRFELVGEGGMGLVFWALDNDLNREVAFKVVRPGGHAAEAPAGPLELSPPPPGTPASGAFETLKARFLQEAWVTAGLEHPGILPVYEMGRTPEGVPYYTMRFVKGKRTFADAIAEKSAADFDQRLELLDPFLRVCDTMRYAHEHGVVHRDLKPENVMLGQFGEVVILDWGLAKMRDRPDATDVEWKERLHAFREAADLRTVASAMGTPGYMSPEAALGRVAEADERADVYSLGCILFEILTGRLPFEFDTYGDLLRLHRAGPPAAAREVDENVPKPLSDICARALASDPEQREQSVESFADAVRSWQTRSAREREVTALVDRAEAAFARAQAAVPDELLPRLDAAIAAAARTLQRDPGNAAATRNRDRARALRSGRIGERERRVKRRAVSRLAMVYTVAAVATLAAVGAFAAERWVSTERAKSAARDAERRAADAEARAAKAEQASRSVTGALVARGWFPSPEFLGPEPGSAHVRLANVDRSFLPSADGAFDEDVWEISVGSEGSLHVELYDRPPSLDGDADASPGDEPGPLLAFENRVVPGVVTRIGVGYRMRLGRDVLGDVRDMTSSDRVIRLERDVPGLRDRVTALFRTRWALAVDAVTGDWGMGTFDTGQLPTAVTPALPQPGLRGKPVVVLRDLDPATAFHRVSARRPTWLQFWAWPPADADGLMVVFRGRPPKDGRQGPAPVAVRGATGWGGDVEDSSGWNLDGRGPWFVADRRIDHPFQMPDAPAPAWVVRIRFVPE